MMKGAKALAEFFSGFDIPAYEENSVPDNAALPYITYQITVPDWRESASITACVWYSGTSFKEIFDKTDEISKYVGEGRRIPVEGGSLQIFKDTPFSQVVSTSKDNVKCVYLIFQIHALCD